MCLLNETIKKTSFKDKESCQFVLCFFFASPSSSFIMFQILIMFPAVSSLTLALCDVINGKMVGMELLDNEFLKSPSYCHKTDKFIGLLR